MMGTTEVHSEIILHVSRILILLSDFSNQKSIKMTLDKIMLLDFYMKYPNIMIDEDNLANGLSYYDYYSYYHWKPNREQYQQHLMYLLAKRLVVRDISGNEFIYNATSEGLHVAGGMNSKYANSLKSVSSYIKRHVARQSDTKIESEIISRSIYRKQLEAKGAPL